MSGRLPCMTAPSRESPLTGCGNLLWRSWSTCCSLATYGTVNRNVPCASLTHMLDRLNRPAAWSDQRSTCGKCSCSWAYAGGNWRSEGRFHRHCTWARKSLRVRSRCRLTTSCGSASSVAGCGCARAWCQSCLSHTHHPACWPLCNRHKTCCRCKGSHHVSHLWTKLEDFYSFYNLLINYNLNCAMMFKNNTYLSGVMSLIFSSLQRVHAHYSYFLL